MPLQVEIAFGALDIFCFHFASTSSRLLSFFLESLSFFLGSDILDVGCGSGILSVVAAKLGASRVVGIEIDDVAVSVGASNVKANEAYGVEVIKGTLPHPDVTECTFDITVANISSREIIKLAPHLVESVRPEGVLIVSGLLQETAGSVVEALSTRGSAVIGTLTEQDWVALVVRAPSPS